MGEEVHQGSLAHYGYFCFLETAFAQNKNKKGIDEINCQMVTGIWEGSGLTWHSRHLATPGLDLYCASQNV